MAVQHVGDLGAPAPSDGRDSGYMLRVQKPPSNRNSETLRLAMENTAEPIRGKGKNLAGTTALCGFLGSFFKKY